MHDSICLHVNRDVLEKLRQLNVFSIDSSAHAIPKSMRRDEILNACQRSSFALADGLLHKLTTHASMSELQASFKQEAANESTTLLTIAAKPLFRVEGSGKSDDFFHGFSEILGNTLRDSLSRVLDAHPEITAKPEKFFATNFGQNITHVPTTHAGEGRQHEGGLATHCVATVMTK